MKIKNYTTKVPVGKSIYEIEQMLAQSKATHIMKTYHGDGRVETLFFKIGEIGYSLPANLEKIKICLYPKKRSKLPKELDAKCERVAWRVLRDWLHAQLSLIQIGQAEVEQIFLPYAHNGKESFYEQIKKRGLIHTQALLDAPGEVSK